MAAFSYQNHSFLLDSVYFPSPPTKSTVFMEKPENDHESSCIVIDEGSGQMITQMEVSSMADNNNKKKRKKKNTEDGSSSSLNSAQPKDEREKKKGRAVKKVGAEEAPTGYVHVRARRGQATDSHSLAERVRREKISKRMKILQGLVPGCDKVTGKALMLDEIINYVQSLQGQVEFLSMKLASLNPLYYDFGIDLDSFMASSSQRLNKLGSSLVQNGEQCSRAAENSFTTSNNCPLLETSTPFAFQQEEMANVLSQGNGELSWDVDIQIPKISGQTGIINNLCFPLM